MKQKVKFKLALRKIEYIDSKIDSLGNTTEEVEFNTLLINWIAIILNELSNDLNMNSCAFYKLQKLSEKFYNLANNVSKNQPSKSLNLMKKRKDYISKFRKIENLLNKSR